MHQTTEREFDATNYRIRLRHNRLCAYGKTADFFPRTVPSHSRVYIARNRDKKKTPERVLETSLKMRTSLRANINAFSARVTIGRCPRCEIQRRCAAYRAAPDVFPVACATFTLLSRRTHVCVARETRASRLLRFPLSSVFRPICRTLQRRRLSMEKDTPCARFANFSPFTATHFRARMLIRKFRTGVSRERSLRSRSRCVSSAELSSNRTESGVSSPKGSLRTRCCRLSLCRPLRTQSTNSHSVPATNPSKHAN